MAAHLPGVKALLKVFVVTAITTYPFIVLVVKLSDIHVDEYSPCNSNACTLFKLVGQQHLPSTVRLWSNPFLMVRNGDKEVGISTSVYLSPRCPGKSAEEMQALCASTDTKKGIINSLKAGLSKALYLCFVAGWFFCKLLHDCLLLWGVSEFCTLCVGLASLAFQLLAVAAAFLWSMSVAEVFVAPLEGTTCGCYYNLGEIQMLLAISTPSILYIMSIRKTEAVFRAVLCGDFLYFAQYDVPYHLVAQSSQDPTGTYLVVSTHGKHGAECKQDLHLRQLRQLHVAYMAVYSVLFSFTVPFSIGTGVGPLVVALMELAIHFVDRQPVISATFPIFIFAILLFVAFVVFVIITLFQKFVDFKECCLLPDFWEWSLKWRIYFLGRAVVISAALPVAAGAIIVPLLRTALGETVTVDASIAGAWALAGLVIYIGGIHTVVNSGLRPARLALAVKARVAGNPTVFLEADKYPEFELVEECKLAKDFLHEFPLGGDHEYAAMREAKWHRALGKREAKWQTCLSLFGQEAGNQYQEAEHVTYRRVTPLPTLMP